MPTATADACIAVAANITVTLTGGGAAQGLALGGDAGSTTLRIVGTAAAPAALVLNGPVEVADASAIVLTSDGSSGDATFDAGANAISNDGSITAAAGDGGSRALAGSLTNTGTVAIEQATSFAGTWLNEGTLTLDGATLTVAGGSFTNGNGGSLAGAGTLALEESALTHAAGTIGADTDVVLSDSDLAIAGGNPAAFRWQGDGDLAGSLVPGQSVDVEATADDAVLRPLAGSANGGMIVLTSSGGAAVVDAGTETFVNSGTLVSTGAAGTRTVRGNLTNTGTVKVMADLRFDHPGNGSWINSGTIEISDLKRLFVLDGETFRAGRIVQTGPDRDPFKKGIVDLTNADLVLTGASGGAFTWHGTGDLTGNVAKGQRITVEGTPASPAVLTAAAGFTNSGAIALTARGGDAEATISMPGRTLVNKGELRAGYGPDGGGRTLVGNVSNRKTVVLELGLTVAGTYTQTAVATFLPFFWEPTAWGSLTASGGATLAGKIKFFRGIPAPGAGVFVPTPGSAFPVIDAPTVSGTFSTLLTPKVSSSDYFTPTYSPTQVVAVVKRVRIVPTPSSGPGGTVLSLDASEFPPGVTVRVKFTDKAKATTAPVDVVTDANGTFALPFTIPSGAAVGKGTFTATIVGGPFKGISAKSIYTVT